MPSTVYFALSAAAAPAVPPIFNAAPVVALTMPVVTLRITANAS